MDEFILVVVHHYDSFVNQTIRINSSSGADGWHTSLLEPDNHQ